MALLERVSTLVRANLNDLIDRAENPEKMLNQLIVDMRTQLAKAKQQVAAAIADESPQNCSWAHTISVRIISRA